VTERIIPRLGDQASDIVTEFEGVVVAITKHLGGTITIALQVELPGGEKREFPEARIRVIKQGWAIPTHMAIGS
jgi:hypothetical protein